VVKIKGPQFLITSPLMPQVQCKGHNGADIPKGVVHSDHC